MKFKFNSLIKIFVILVLTCLLFYIIEKLSRSNRINLPNLSDVKKIVLVEKNIKINVNEKKEIEEIYKILKKQKSLQRNNSEFFKDANMLMKISFDVGGEEKNTLKIYKKTNSYYIEDSNNVSFRLNENEYKNIGKYLVSEYTIGEISNYNITNEQITIDFNYSLKLDDYAILTIKNLTSHTYEYGAGFMLEIFYNNEWHKINWKEEPNFILILYKINSNETNENKIDGNFLMSLQKGKYRIVKSFNEVNSENGNVVVYASAEFEI